MTRGGAYNCPNHGRRRTRSGHHEQPKRGGAQHRRLGIDIEPGVERPVALRVAQRVGERST